jgi:hypothetical protein
MKNIMFYKNLPKEITYRISKYSLNVFFLCIGNQLTEKDVIDLFKNYEYSKDEYFDIIEYSLIPTLLYFNKFSYYEKLNLNWSVNDTVLAYYAIKYKRYSIIQRPFFIDKLFLEGLLKNYPKAFSAIGHYLYYIPEDTCYPFFRRYHCQGQNVFRPSKYSIQFKNKEVYYKLLKELLPDYAIYEKYIYGSPSLIEHLNNVLDIDKIVNQAEEKNCSLRSPYASPSPTSSLSSSDDRKSFNSNQTTSSCSQEINKFYPYLYDYLFLFDSSNAFSKEKILKLTMNSWNCSVVSLILYDVFQGKNYGSRRSSEKKLEYQKYLVNAKRIVNAYTLEDDLLQYRLIKDKNYLALENLLDVYSKILEYDIGKAGLYRIDHLFHIFFPSIVLLIINKNVKGLKAYMHILIHKHWIEHVIALFDYAIEFYQFELDKFPNRIEKLKRKYASEVKHYKFALNKFLGVR